MSERYNLYHKHTHYSNIFTPDTHTKAEEYIKRAVELGHTSYFTTEHGSGGDIFEAKTLCEKYGIKCVFGIEGYIVKDPLEKDRSNFHIVIIPRTNVARKKLNKITSRANREGFYYKPRIFLEDLLGLDKDDVYITNACIAGILKTDESYLDIFLPLYKHFGGSILLEIQSHNVKEQIELNQKVKPLSEELGLEIVTATDSHYILPEDAKDRLVLLSGKHINYGDEDNFILDYPNSDTLLQRFLQQGVFNKEEIEKAIRNTLIFDNCEEISINKEIKMPTIYPNLTADEKIQELRNHIDKKFYKVIEQDGIRDEDLPKYKEAIEYEFSVINDTKELNTADYFLLDEKLIDLATTKYGGILTRTGRGSAASYYLNRVLGITQIDRLNSNLPLFPERFISTARLLENRSVPDIDMNVVSQEPFLKATRELLGDNGCFPMIAYGTMQISEAFRNLCRSKDMDYEDFNDVAKDLEKYKDDKKWEQLYLEAEKFVDTIVSASVHPCAFVLFNGDLEEELGVVKIGDNICCMITSNEADDWKYLKNDYLIVSVWELISKTFEEIGKPIFTIKELNDNVDDRVWDMYEKGLTCTLNQADSDWATTVVKQYKPRSAEDMAKFVACIRPSFNSWRNSFVERKDYTSGNIYMDNLFTSTDKYILFQENLMQYFVWLGVSASDSIGMIKKISKKKIRQEDFDNLEKSLRENWIEKTGSEDDFQNNWDMVQSCISYGFNAPHGLAVAYDSIYGAYLKSHYPLQYYAVALNLYKDDQDRTSKMSNELKYFKIPIKTIKFRRSKSEYSYDTKENSIYKGIGSIKFLSQECADDLYALKDNQYTSFVNLLLELKTKRINSRQLDILTKLDFFSEFGNAKELLRIIDWFNFFKQGDAKTIKKEKINEEFVQSLMNKYAKDTNAKGQPLKSYTIIDCQAILHEGEEKIKSFRLEDMDVLSKIRVQKEYLGYVSATEKEEDRAKLLVEEIYPLKRKKDGKQFGYSIICNSIGSGKKTRFTVFSKDFNRCGEITKGDIVLCIGWKRDGEYFSMNEYKKIY